MDARYIFEIASDVLAETWSTMAVETPHLIWAVAYISGSEN